MTGLWDDCLGYLQHELPTQQYNTWIRPLIASTENGQLVLSAPNRFVKDWVKDKYLQRIQEILSELNGGRITHVDVTAGESRPMFSPQAAPRPEPRPAASSVEGFAFAAPRVEAEEPTSTFSPIASSPLKESPSTNNNNEFGRQSSSNLILPGQASFNTDPMPSAPVSNKPKRNVQVEGGIQHQSFLNSTFTLSLIHI